MVCAVESKTYLPQVMVFDGGVSKMFEAKWFYAYLEAVSVQEAETNASAKYILDAEQTRQ